MALCTKSNNDSKHWSRINGWSPPLHFLQLLAWLFIIMFALLYFGVLVPNLPKAWQITASVINSLIFFTHVIVHLVSVSLNPADPNVRAKNYRGPLPHFDRSQHAHVIENQFCYICEVKVGIQSKHCSACNKCISGFDHHCRWLNNCIGERNYKLFIICVTTALVGCLLVFVTSCTLVGAYFSSDSWLYKSELLQNIEMAQTGPTSTQSTSFLDANTTAIPIEFYDNVNKTSLDSVFYVFIPVHSVLWIIVVIVTLFLSLVATGLLTHLLGFHIYLMCIKHSTYEYIISKRDNEETSSQNSCCNWKCEGNILKKLLLKKANQISPTSNSKDSSEDNEFTMKSTLKHQTKNSNGSETVSIPVLNITVPKDKSSQENSLEQFVGNVYLGSPERQRHFLEPIYVNNRKMIRTNIEKNKSHMETVLSGDKENKCSEEHSQNVEKESISSHLNVSSMRKRHPSASTTSILPPIMETENAESPTLSKWYRSVSAQSLNSLSDTDDFRSLSSNKDGAILPGLAKRVNSSLSNLLFSMEESQEMNSDQNDSDDEVSCQNFTQSTDTKDSELGTNNVSSTELLNENDDERNDFTPNVSFSEKDDNSEQWANTFPKRRFYNFMEDVVSNEGIIEENLDEVKVPSPRVELSHSLSQNDLTREQFGSIERRLSLSEKPPLTKNNFFTAPLFRPANNSKVVVLGNNKDDTLNETHYYNSQANSLTDNSEVTIFDSIIFDTQRSYSNITPVV